MVCEVLQAENASYLGPAFSDFAGWPGVPANWLGTGYIDWGNAIGDYVTWQVESGAFAQCSLSFRYAFKVGHGDCPKQLFVNDQVVQTVSFPGTAWMPRGTLDSRTADAWTGRCSCGGAARLPLRTKAQLQVCTQVVWSHIGIPTRLPEEHEEDPRGASPFFWQFVNQTPATC